MKKENCECEKAGYKEHCLACKVNGLCLCGIPREVGVSSNQTKENWKDKIYKDYSGILSDKQIEETIQYWDNFLKSQRAELIEEIEKEFEASKERINGFAKDYFSGARDVLEFLLTKLKNK